MNPLVIFNTLTMQKEIFKPLSKNKVCIYACGPTVYNFFHIGNARAFLFFDVVKKYLKFSGFNVVYVQNITDIEDKIIKKAAEEDRPFTEIALKYTDAFYDDLSALGIEKADYNPKATDYIADMISLIRKLELKGFAYESRGDVFFSVESCKVYGKLSKKRISDLKSGARVAENDKKRNPLDFTLWKKAKPGEPKWDSPWGEGRPGWHTECVVMSQHLLGETFDIHCGGTDLVFPHHENEIAQAEALTGKPLANYWIHNGFINMEGEKMSKSSGNFFTAREILKKYDSDEIRLFFLSKHYRSPIDFNTDILDESKHSVRRMKEAILSVFTENDLPQEMKVNDFDQEYVRTFTNFMNDDFNTALAITLLHDLTKKINTSSGEIKKKYAHTLLLLGRVLGFFQTIQKEDKLQGKCVESDLIELLIGYRKYFKEQRKWEMSDKIRDDLKNIGIYLQDEKDRTVWKKGT